MGLFKSAWMSTNETKARRAVAGITDQGELAHIATEAPITSVRCAAVARITDQATLARIVSTDPDKDVCEAAAGRITDADTLIDLVSGDAQDWIKAAVIRRITDKSILKTVFATLGEHEEEARKEALLGIGDEWALMTWIEIDQQNPVHTLEAVNRLAALPGECSNDTLQTLIQVFGMLCEEYGTHADQIYQTLGKMMNIRFLTWCFTQSDDQFALCHFDGLVPYVPKILVLDACRSVRDKERLKSIYKQFRIVDKKIIKSPCEYGEHAYSTVRTYWTERSEAENCDDRSLEIKVSKCNRCGDEAENNTGNWN